MSNVIKLSRPGYPYNTSVPRQLIFSSDYNNFKIHAQGATSITIGASGTTATKNILHGLGYTPAFVCIAEADGTYSAYRWLVNFFSIEPGTDYTGISVYAGDNYLTIYAERDTLESTYPAAKTINLYYFIFKESGI
jgi:hypothetical protein